MFWNRKSDVASPESTTTPPAEPWPSSSVDRATPRHGVGRQFESGLSHLNPYRPTICVVGQSELTISRAST